MMKFKNVHAIIILVVTSLLLSWAIPAVVKMTTTTSQRYPFVYFSSLVQKFTIREAIGKETSFYDTDGHTYTREQYDSITPLLSYKQLILSGSMPDSILGVKVEPKELRASTVIWRYLPKYVSTPSLDLFLMYESMSGRTRLESPEDVFRLKENIEFITKETNTVDKEKSALFQAKLEEEGFTFPAKQVWGNMSPKKPYDEGYFVLDANNQLYHVKMQKGLPYVVDTKSGKDINIAFFEISEVADRSIYGFIVSEEGDIYRLNTDGYTITKFDIPRVDIHNDNLLLMGNLFYWMVNVTTDTECTYNVLDAKSLMQHKSPYSVKGEVDKWNTVSNWLFPTYTTFTSKDSDYLKPVMSFNIGIAFLFSLVLALAFTFTIGKKRNLVKRIACLIVIILFGIPGLIASLIVK